MPYSDLLKRLDLESLELRRLYFYADLIVCYKIVFGLVDLHNNDFFALSTVTHTRGHRYELFKKRHHHFIRSSFFSERDINVWNNLPTEVLFSSITAFKRSIRKVDFTY